MALKDWSKPRIIEGNYTYYSKKDNVQVDVWKWRKGQIHYPESSVYVYARGDEVLRQHFKTKRQALKFAKEYMEEN